jgi:hypothetical protein
MQLIHSANEISGRIWFHINYEGSSVDIAATVQSVVQYVYYSSLMEPQVLFALDRGSVGSLNTT